MFPANGSVTRHSLPYTGSPRVEFPCCNGTTKCSDFPPLIRPRFGCPSLGRTSPCACVRSLRTRRRSGGLELWAWQPHARNYGKATTGPLRFLGNPGVHTPCSSTPAGPTRQDIRRSRRGPRIGNDEGSREFTVFRGSIARPLHSLSTLRPGDCSTRTQDSLPAAVRSTGRDWLPTGFQRKVSEVLLTSLPPFPSLPDAMPTNGPVNTLPFRWRGSVSYSPS
jgi:hypothetical protein